MIDANLAGDMDLYLWGGGFDCDPDFALSVFTTDQILSWSDCFYSNEEYDAMYAAQHVSSDPQQRQAIIVDMQKHLYEQAPYVVLAYSSNIVAHRTDTFTGWGDVSKYPGWDVYWWNYATDLVPVTAATTTAMTETEMTTQTTVTEMPPAPGPGIEVYAGVIAIIIIVLAALAVLLRRRKKETTEKEES
jgi:ABC-type transport system substrate-binding protein